MPDDFRCKRKSVNDNLIDYINAQIIKIRAFKERTGNPLARLYYLLFLLNCQGGRYAAGVEVIFY